MWQELKTALHAEKQDWQVWTTWYDARLEGRVQEEERELAYVRIDSGLWEQGSAIVNAEIKRLIETHTPPTQSQPVLPEASIEVAIAAGASRAGAAKTGIARSRRPVFKGFFSYSHSDAEVDPHIVEAFSSELEKRIDANLVNASFEIWRDKAKLAAGDYWDLSIETAIKSAHIFVVLMTPKWISSDYCRKEFEAFESVEFARNSRGYVIPIYGRDIERQTKYLETGQKELLDRMKRIQHQNVIPREFARLSGDERIDLIEGVAEPICALLNRLRDNQET
jgi:TIR domain